MKNEVWVGHGARVPKIGGEKPKKGSRRRRKQSNPLQPGVESALPSSQEYTGPITRSRSCES